MEAKAKENQGSNRVFADGDTFYVLGVFDDQMRDGLVWALTRKIDELKKQREAKITVYINSYGGSGELCFHLVSLLELAKRNGIVVRTVVTGAAYSSGSILAVVGTKGERYIDSAAEHLVHYGQFDGYRKTTPLQIERGTDRWKRWTKTVLKHYEKFADIPGLADHMKDDDFFIPADKCIKWGLADKYMEELQ